MALAFNNATSTLSAASGATTSFTVAAGHDVVVGVGYDNTTDSVSSVTDSGGNPYTKVGSAPNVGGALTVEEWRSHAIATGITTVTVTMTSGSTHQRVIGDYSGINTYINSNTATGSGLNPTINTSGSFTSGDWSIAIHGWYKGSGASGALSAVTGNVRATTTSAAIRVAVALVDNTGTTTATTASFSTLGNWSAVTTEVTPAASTIPVFTRRQRGWGF